DQLSIALSFASNYDFMNLKRWVRNALLAQGFLSTTINHKQSELIHLCHNFTYWIGFLVAINVMY
ncbi:hypothetical protein, partial [Vibrio sp. V14_P6S14T42]|uniref:hypothetical protein n=1 Tax=Vibrio sp. V14_P6S14T42 TaxID=1938668 RepID=UPI000B9F5A17